MRCLCCRRLGARRANVCPFAWFSLAACLVYSFFQVLSDGFGMPFRFFVSLTVLLGVSLDVQTAFAAELNQPNILWLSCEDISPHLGCYGDVDATTPVLDAFAKEAVLYERAYTTAGVCAPCRSAIITGMYQTSIGTQHMRCEARLPEHIKPFPFWMKQAGYYCTNNSKQDYQFRTPKGTWDASSGKAHWKNRPGSKQPFFAVFNYTGCHESGIASSQKYKQVVAEGKVHDRNVVAASLPPYYPKTQATLDDWGRYYDVITAMDRWVGEHLRALEAAGLADDTIVVFWSDHGVGLPRAKRWLYESGTHVPLIVRVPEKWRSLAGAQMEPGTRSQQLVSMIDLGPSMLSLAGIQPPAHMQGRAFLGPHAEPARQYVFGARDRMDERYDIIRMVRDQRFRYVRNYEPYKTWYQFMNTPEQGRTMQEIRRAASEPDADSNWPQMMSFLKPRKPLEELYDVQNDPHELHNLADDPQFADQLQELREQHRRWVLETRDLGLVPEAELHRLREQAGSEWAILNAGTDSDARMQVIRDAAILAGGTAVEDLGTLQQWLHHKDATVRYWAATGIGNRTLPVQAASQLRAPLTELLQDECENTVVAAARALATLGETPAALQALTGVLDHGTQWARVHAAIVLDEMDEQARPVLEAMQRNKAYRKEFVADGKYTVRVLNKALNDLQGTSLTVP